MAGLGASHQGLGLAVSHLVILPPAYPLPAFCHTCRFVAGQGDFAEGVTATLIDRGRQPAWKYSSVGQVPGRVVAAFFETEGSVEPSVKPNSRM